MEKVAAIVVTYNRKKLLEECLDALLAQSYQLDKIWVINNCSMDGTEKLFEKDAKYDCPNIKFYTTKKNLGGAGGFCEGIKLIDSTEYDWVWIMDDDTIPNSDSLEELMNANTYLKENEKKRVGFLASTVYGPEGEPMNVPVLQTAPTENGYADWYKHLSAGLVKVKSATFVSVLVPYNAIKSLGYPIAEYFIWGDDTEYTQRISTKYGDGYFCGKSIVLHKRFNAKNISIFSENDPKRISMYSYFFRNSLLNAKKYNTKLNVNLHMCEYILKSFQCLFGKNIKYRVKKFVAIQKGIFQYFSFDL